MKRKIVKFTVVLFIFIFSGCNLFAGNFAPYIIDGEMVLDSSSKYEIAGLNFHFFNKSEKQIKNFTVVFYMYDEDGNPPGTGRNNVVVNITASIKGNENLNGCISLDEYLYEIPEVPYSIDYLYVSKITYADDSVWSDPLGLSVF